MGLGLGEGHARRLGGGDDDAMQTSKGSTHVDIFGCPLCGDVYFGETSDGQVAAGVPSPCCDEPLSEGELVVGRAYTPRKLCEELREVPRDLTGPATDPEPNTSIVPALGGLASRLNVLVEYVDDPDEIMRPFEPDLEASEKVGGALDGLILFPAGTIVYLAPEGDVRQARVVGYQVKDKSDMAWDIVSPRCAKCERATAYGEVVTVELMQPPLPWRHETEMVVPPWAPGDKPRPYTDVLAADGDVVVSDLTLERATAIVTAANNGHAPTLALHTRVAVVGSCCAPKP